LRKVEEENCDREPQEQEIEGGLRKNSGGGVNHKTEGGSRKGPRKRGKKEIRQL